MEGGREDDACRESTGDAMAMDENTSASASIVTLSRVRLRMRE